MATIGFKRAGDAIILIGDTKGHLGQSLYLREIEGREEGTPPPVDLAEERRNGDLVRSLIESKRTETVHDVSDGGLLIAVAEMAMAGGIGAKLTMAGAGIAALFGEDQARYVIAVAETEAATILSQAEDANVPARIIGLTGGGELVLNGQAIAVAALRAAHESWFPNYMGAGPV
jgi:phosphoribosylformylglycinamidine synthase